MYTLLVFSSDTRFDIQFIHGDSESVVEYKRHYFDLLWNRGMPARSRICNNRQDSGMRVWNASRDIFIYSIEVEEHRKTKQLVIRIFANFR